MTGLLQKRGWSNYALYQLHKYENKLNAHLIFKWWYVVRVWRKPFIWKTGKSTNQPMGGGHIDNIECYESRRPLFTSTSSVLGISGTREMWRSLYMFPHRRWFLWRKSRRRLPIWHMAGANYLNYLMPESRILISPLRAFAVYLSLCIWCLFNSCSPS
jgi:hypothetical protein